MCLAIPAKILNIEGESAIVSIEEVEYKASLLLLPDAEPGDYVMIHAGFAIEKVDPDQAAETLRLLKEIGKTTLY
jgi:hydrogenase expression/formation protein HypC